MTGKHTSTHTQSVQKAVRTKLGRMDTHTHRLFIILFLFLEYFNPLLSTPTRVSNDEVNFQKQPTQEETAENVSSLWGRALFMLSAKTMLKSRAWK